MRYKNKKTGAIIDSSSKIVGDNWVELTNVSSEKTTEGVVEEEVDLSEMTNKELEEFAKEHDIELTAEDKKNKETRIAAIAKNFE